MKLQHFGPEPHHGSGAEMVHYMIHERSVGKTIASVYLGDTEPFESLDPENSPPDGIFRSEYLCFEFSDGTALVLAVASGNSFHCCVKPEAGEILARAKTAGGGSR